MTTKFIIKGRTRRANLVWHSSANRSYMLRNDGWAPSVAELSQSLLGGKGAYDPVEDTRAVDVFGETTEEATANLENLALLLEEAERWQRGEQGYGPVLIEYIANNGTIVQHAAILGRAPGDQSRMQLQATFNEELRGYVISNVQLRFRRTVFFREAGIENPVKNWSFEDYNEAVPLPPRGWTVENSPVLTYGPGYHDTQCLHIQGTASAGPRGVWQDITGLVVGQTYIISVYARLIATQIELRAYDGGGFLNPTFSIISSGSEWERRTLLKVCPASGSIRIFIGVSTGGGEAEFDGVLINPGIQAWDIEDVDVNTSVTMQPGSAPMVCSLGDHPIASPIRARLEFRSAADAAISTAYSQWPSYLLFTNDRPHIETVPGSFFGSGSGYSLVAPVAGDNAYSSVNLLRYTPAGTTEVKNGSPQTLTLGRSRFDATRLVAFVVCRASVANQFTLRGYAGTVVISGTQMLFEVASEPVTVPGTSTVIIPLVFPTPLRVNMSDGGISFVLSIQSSAAAGSIDIDRVIFLNTTPEADSYIVGLNESMQVFQLTTSGTYDLLVDPAPLSRPRPIAGILQTGATDAGSEYSFNYSGVPDLYLRGPQVCATWIAVGNAEGSAQGTYWQFTDPTPSNATVYARLLVSRRRTHLVPR